MMMNSDLFARLEALEPVGLDDQPWFRIRDLCEALRLDQRRAAACIPPEHKKRWYEYRRGFRSRILSLTDLSGAERFIIRYAPISRSEAMTALHRAAAEFSTDRQLL